MLKKLFPPKQEDICPNCGTACFATDVLCPHCGENLDELFEQLPVELPKPKAIISISRKYELLIKWVLATSIGFAVGKLLLSPIAFMFVPFSLPKNGVDFFGILLRLASGVAIGISVGGFQWLLLKNYIPSSWRWIIATLFGMASGGFIEGLLYVATRLYLPIDATTEIWTLSGWVIILTYGVVIGLTQWVILRKLMPKAWT